MPDDGDGISYFATSKAIALSGLFWTNIYFEVGKKNKMILKRNEFSPERGIPPLFGPQRCRSPSEEIF